MGFIIVILMRVLKNDFNRYNRMVESTEPELQEQFDGFEDDNGWKMVHADVFRFPTHPALFCSILGVGCQFMCLATGIILMAVAGLFHPHRHGAINTAAVLLYALTSCVAGFVSSSYYRKFNGKRYILNVVITSSLFTAPFFFVWCVINGVHWYAGSTQALPFTTILLLIFIWILVGFPLTIIGAIFGWNHAENFEMPCRTKPVPRPIPPQAWYRNILVHSLLGGFLPFSAISVELYYVFATIWGREQYTLYGILLIVFVILLSVSACVSVALTYFQLSSEDWRWWWRSLFSAGSIAIFVFAYGLFYYEKRSNMSGIVQSVEFFGYLTLICYVFFLTLGSLGFFSSLQFIKYIYLNLKMD